MLKLNIKYFRFFTLSLLLLISHQAMVETQACGSLLSGCCKLTGIIATGCCDASCCLLRAFCCCTLSSERGSSLYEAPKPDIRTGEWPEEAELRRKIEQLQRNRHYLGMSQEAQRHIELEIGSLKAKYSGLQMGKLKVQAMLMREEKLAAEKLAQEQAVQARMEPASFQPFPLQQ